MSETAVAEIRPEEMEVKKSLAAPTETPEAKPTPEQERWAKSGAHSLMLLGRSEIGDGLSKKDESKLKAIATKNHLPETKDADAAASNLSNKYWEGKSSEDAYDEWSESLDAYLAKQEGNDFFERMKFTNKDGGADAIKNRFLMTEDGKQFRKNSIGEFAKAIVDKNNPQQIEENMASIREMAQLFGGLDENGKPIKEQIDAVIEHIHALSNLRSDPDKFIESAHAEMDKGEAMKGSETLTWIRDNAKQYNEKREAKMQELGEEKALQKRISEALGNTVDTETYNRVQQKIDQAGDATEIYLDPEADEDRADNSGLIRIADIEELKDENGKPLDQIAAFARLLEELNKNEKINITNKIEGWVWHEAQHFAAAQEHFDNVSIRIKLSKNPDGTYTVHPDTHYAKLKNENLSEDEQRRLEGEVATAPGLGKTSEDLYGMSKHDLADVGLYVFENTPEGLRGHPTEAVTKAREFMNNPEKQQEITQFIDSLSKDTLTDDARSKLERTVCLDIALKIRNKRKEGIDWQINLNELYGNAQKENESRQN